MDFFHTHISERAIELADKVLRSTFISEGEFVKQFEGELSQRLGFINPVAVNSGTSALHLALAVAGVGKGHEVILPAQTFVATGLAVLMQGAIPVFADIQYETGNIEPTSIREKITKKTKAIVPVHWGGYPCDMDAINSIAEEHGLTVIEDAAHALGAIYKGRPIGSISHFIYSLNPMVGVIDGFRWCLFGGKAALYLPGFWMSVGITLILLISGLYYFKRMERTFADII